MKQYLSSIVQGYGYKNVKEFLAEFKASKAEYGDYRKDVAKWEQQTGNKAESDSMKAKLQRKQQEVKERENSRQSHRHKNDRGQGRNRSGVGNCSTFMMCKHKKSVEKMYIS